MNGSVYFDKPLLTYWAMLPFVWVGGVNEAMLRLPGTIAGAGSVLILFLIGRRLFGARAGFFSAAFLLTAPMFLFWSRTASAEAVNTFTILLMFWAFLKARLDNRPGFLLLFYAIGAAGCFVKGPVAPAVCLFAVLFFSAIESGLRIKKGRMAAALWKIVGEEFSWLLSGAAVKGILCGLLLFSVLLLLPVMSSGSWVSARLMWRENVIRFLAPFDHRDPPSVYLVSILQLSAPWTLIVLSGLARARSWKAGVSRRWTLACASGVLLFFLISASRRSYYILPFIPFLALIAGKSVTDWIEATQAKGGLMGLAVAATAGLFICVAAALCYVYLSMPAYRHGSEVVVALLGLPGQHSRSTPVGPKKAR
jgi:4-amino-4-deoxy-L-arabinose transferase-like glycosyltransferase